ncbi:polysaccharide deacetylase family protein [Bradyrhizobium sp. BR 1432]|uniref:polysaccharide deacetylase family protein n=1 Tax=Bradyrhizobium sp. BR 1432 TaxID=3447966 RepID=UPI003EE81031
MISLAQRKQHAWPDGARCVVGLTLDFDGTSLERGRGQLPLGARSHGRYSAKCGIPRFVDMFTRHSVPWTFYVSGYDAEESPDLVRDISRSGIEIGSHGYFHEGVDPGDAEPELLERTHRLLTEITGVAPRGWRSPSGHKTARTLSKLRELGYVYDSSDKDFDLPYLARYDGEERSDYVCLPNNTSSLDDFPFYRVSYTPPSEVLTHWEQEFDAIYAEGGYYNLTFHPRVGYGSGSPARVAAVEGLIKYAKRHEGVRFVGMLELAEWCLKRPSDWRRDWSGQ